MVHRSSLPQSRSFQWGLCHSLLPITILALLLISPLRLRAQYPEQGSGHALRFVENKGQVPTPEGAEPVLFIGEQGRVRFHLRSDGLSYVYSHRNAPSRPGATVDFASNNGATTPLPPSVNALYRVDMQFVGSNRSTVVVPEEPLTETLNFYYPHCPDGISGVRAFGRVTYRNIYPSIDLVYHADNGGLKYDFVVRPGGRVSDIKMRYIGAAPPAMLSDGTVRIANPLGELIEGRPLTYQSDRGVANAGSAVRSTIEVPSHYQLDDGVISFEIGDYDSSRTLIIDPSLLWSTYAGGSDLEMVYEFGGGGPVGNILGTDSRGGIYFAGTTESLDYPTTPGAMQRKNEGYYDAVLVGMSSDGRRRWSTYIGGQNWDWAGSIAVDSIGGIAVTGITNSHNFPVTPGAMQPYRRGGNYDVWIARFSNDGRRIWSTYYGGSGIEHTGGCAIDGAGNVVVGGTTWSPDLPVSTSGFQTRNAGAGDAFVVKIDATGRRLWGTYIGGSDDDWGSELAIDRRGYVVTTGATQSPNFPVTSGAFQTTMSYSGSPGNNEATIVQLDPQGHRVWATYIGGENRDWGYGIDVDCRNNIIVCGTTRSIGFPTTPGAAQKNLSSTNRADAFMASFDPDGRSRWITLYGGRAAEYGSGVGAAHNGHVFLIGHSTSTDLLHTGRGYQTKLGGEGDLFLVEFDSNGVLIWDTYYGGSGTESGSGIAGDGVGGIVIAGYTNSRDISIVNGDKTTLDTSSINGARSYDYIVARFCNALSARPIPDGAVTFCEGDSVVLSAPPGYLRFRWIPGGETSRTITVRASGIYSIYIEDSLGCSGVSDTIAVVVNTPATANIVAHGPTVFCEGNGVMLEAAGNYPGLSYRWSTGDSTQRILAKSAGTYSVMITDSNGCSVVSAITTVSVLDRPVPPRLSDRDTIWLCADSTLVLDAGIGYQRYKWSSGETTRMVPAREGTFFVEVISAANDCPAFSDTVVVRRVGQHPRPITVSGDYRLCAGESVMLDAGEGFASYSWSNGATSRTIQVSSAGTYSLRLLDTNGCSLRSDTVNIQMDSAPVVSILPVGQTTFCEGGSVILDAGEGYGGYRWSSGDTTRYIEVDAPGEYTVAVVRTGGWCEAVSQPITVTVQPLPEPDISYNGPSRFPDGDSLVMEVDAGYASYVWNNAETGRYIVVRTSGEYSVVVTDSNGCAASSAVVDVTVIPRASATLRIPELMGAPGHTIRLPLLLQGAHLSDNGLSSVRGTIRFNRSILRPLAGVPAGWTEGADYVVPFNAQIGDYNDTSEILSYEFLVMLGDSASSLLRLENIVFDGGPLLATLVNGKFSLDAYCDRNGGRLLSASRPTALRSVRPDPARDNTTIAIDLVEAGVTRLSIVDLLGRQVAVVADEWMLPGEYSMQMSVGTLPAGAYLLMLETPTERYGRVFQVVR